MCRPWRLSARTGFSGDPGRGAAAAKTAAGLERLDYIAREADPADARAVLLKPTAHGIEMLTLSAEIFDRLRAGWSAELGAERLAGLEDDLRRIVAPSGAKLGDLPGWLR